MKKFLFLGIAAVMLIGLAAPSQAAVVTGTSISWQISVTVSSGGRNFTATVDALSFPVGALGAVEYSNQVGSGNPRCTIENIGTTTDDLQVMAAVASAGDAWTLAAAPGDDIATLSGVWTVALDSTGVGGRDLNATDFNTEVSGTDDVITTAWGTATATNYASPNDTGSFINGVQVSSVVNQNIRSMRFELQYPTAATNSDGDAQTITVTISAGN